MGIPSLRRGKRNSNKKLGIIIIAILGVLIVGGYIGQFIGYIFSGTLFSPSGGGRITMTFNPFISIWYAVSTIYGWIGILLVSVAVLVIYLYMRNFDRFFAKENDSRNFRRSDKGTYGTAKLMDKDDVYEALDVYTAEKTEGIILGQLSPREVVSIPVDQTKYRANRNIAVYGAPGTGKSYCFVRPAILQCAKRGESIIITDCKGELYNDTSYYLRKMGYEVMMFNTLHPENSDAWNCMADIANDPSFAGKIEGCQKFAKIVVMNTQVGNKAGIFDQQIEALLTALAEYVVLPSPLGPQDMEKSVGSIYKLLTTFDIPELEELIEGTTEETHPCRQPFQTFKNASPNQKSGIVSGLLGKLQVYQNPIINKITKYNEIDLERPAFKKCAYFLITSDRDRTYRFLSSLFFSFLFIRILNAADAQPDGKCPVPVNLVLDEFPNIGVVPDFTSIISTARGRDVRMSVIFQSVSQLMNRYPEGQWEEIIGDCAIQMVLGVSTDNTTAKFVSDFCGTMTVDVNSIRTGRSSIMPVQMIPGYTKTDSIGKRQVFTPDEVMSMHTDNLIIKMQNKQPALLEKFPWTSHPAALEMDRMAKAIGRNSLQVHQTRHIPRWRRMEEAAEKQTKAAVSARQSYKTQTPVQESQPEQPDISAKPQVHAAQETEPAAMGAVGGNADAGKPDGNLIWPDGIDNTQPQTQENRRGLKRKEGKPFDIKDSHDDAPPVNTEGNSMADFKKRMGGNRSIGAASGKSTTEVSGGADLDCGIGVLKNTGSASKFKSSNGK